MTASAGDPLETRREDEARISDSIDQLFHWLEENHYTGWDTFDGLSSVWARPLTFEIKTFNQILQQGIRRFPLNLRPLFGVRKGMSTKAMGFFARGFIRLHQTTQNPRWSEKARFCLDWLREHTSPGYSGACWGNHFDYQSRNSFIARGVPTIVWTSLIGHAFLDGYEYFGSPEYLRVAESICEHITRDLRVLSEGEARCFDYFPEADCWVHNSNTLGACFLARTCRHTPNPEYLDLACRAMLYTASHQRPDGSWYYGEKSNMAWVDNFHTAYVLDCFRHYQLATGDAQFAAVLDKGYDFWKRTFIQADGTPRYYDSKAMPIDIQCSSQAIDTLVFFSPTDPEALPLARKVALWTIDKMQDRKGFFYYRRYALGIVNKTPTLHWGQATMMSALASLLQAMRSEDRP
jgi:rhamnogalacturonyl hydrolase YesR